MGTTIESLELEIQASSTSAVSGIDALSESLTRLKNATQDGIKLNSMSNQIRKIGEATQTLNSAGINNLTQLSTALVPLGNLRISSSIGAQITSIATAVTTLNGTDFSTISNLATALALLGTIGSVTGLQSIITQLRRLPQIASELQTVDWNTLTANFTQLSTALAPLATQLDTVSTSFSRLPTNINGISTATNNLTTANRTATTSYVNLLSKWTLAIRAARLIARVLSSLISKSNEYVEDLNLFNASMGKYAEEAQNYAENVAELMGIDPAEWMRNQGVFNTIITGFGVASDRAYIMSKNLTQLGYDLSSFFNISFEDAMTKIQSGISGELEPLRRLGYDLSQARLQAIALSLGIKKSFNDMTQAEKAQLRYYAIMKQVTVAQGDMARTLNAPANQLRVLKAQVTQCARALGNIFIPALNAVLPYVTALVKVLRLLANEVASFVGFTLPEVDYSGISSVADSAEAAADGLEDATTAAKKLKNSMVGFDELNIISATDSDSDSNSDGFNFDLPTYDFLSGLVESQSDEIVNAIMNSLGEIGAVISAFELAIGAILVFTGANIPLGVALMVLGAAKIYTEIALSWDTMSVRLAEALTLLMGALGGFYFALGAVLAFSGNLPLGIALMVAGGTFLVTSGILNWKKLGGTLESTLTMLESGLGGFFFGIGAVLAFSGFNIPLGIALMAAGALTLMSSAALNWDSLPDKIKSILADLESALGGFLFGLGAVLAFSGINIPTGIILMAAGAVMLVQSGTLDWSSLKNNIEEATNALTLALSTAFLAIGAVLTFTGISPMIGIPLMLLGFAGVASAVTLKWGEVNGKVEVVLKSIEQVVSIAALAIGAIMTLSGANIPLGIALLVGGFMGIVTSTSTNWSEVKEKIKSVTDQIYTAVCVAFLALGAVFTFSGANLPLGIALLALGAVGLIAQVALNWGLVSGQIESVCKTIERIVGGASIALGAVLCFSGVAVSAGIALMVAGVGALASSTVNWNSVTEPLNNVVTESNNIIDNALDTLPEKTTKAQESGRKVMTGISDGILEGFENEVDTFIRSIDFGNGWTTSSNISTGITTKIPTYANGGTVDEGQMFIAREAGPELVGSIGGKTTVANNNQIVSAVANGVAQAVSSVMSNSSNNQTSTKLSGTFRVKGNDLVYVVDKTNKSKGLTISKNFKYGGR